MFLWKSKMLLRKTHFVRSGLPEKRVKSKSIFCKD